MNIISSADFFGAININADVSAIPKTTKAKRIPMRNNPQTELAIAERETPLLLAVDDDIIIRSMLKKALQRQGYEVIEAPNGAEAVELFRKHRPDRLKQHYQGLSGQS